MTTGQPAGVLKATIEEMIRPFGWYQRIPLGHGVYTPGEGGDSEAKLELIQLPEDLSGKSVLDIGCNEGFFSFEAERRGAARVLAADASEKPREKFELLKQILGSRVDFNVLNVYDLDASLIGRFDLVLFLAVFHHLRYPFLALDKVASVTGGMAIMEVPIAVPRLSPEDVGDEPMMLRRVGRTGRLHLLPTLPFLVEVLRRADFDKIDLLGTHGRRRLPGYAERYVQERMILKAYKEG